jgi:hypothetical protein
LTSDLRIGIRFRVSDAALVEDHEQQSAEAVLAELLARVRNR